MVSFTALPDEIFGQVFEFLNQTELVAIARCSQRFHRLSVKKLYRSLCVRRDPRLHTDHWFIDTNFTEVAGLQNIYKRSDQNDYIIYLKLLCLQESLVKYGDLVRQVIITRDIFAEDAGYDYINTFIEVIKTQCKHIENITVHDPRIKTPQLPSLTAFTTSHLKEIDDTAANLTSLTVNMHRYTEDHELPDLTKLTQLRELILEDEECASLRLLKILSDAGTPKLRLKRLAFNHVHGLHDYNTVLRALTVEFVDACIDISSLEELEMTIGCQENGCHCLDDFLDDLAPKLTSIRKVALREQTFQRDHYITEAWDVNIGRFLLNVKGAIKFLAIHHNPPLDGKLSNALEGNYLRRRRLFEKVVPELNSLETFVCPTFLQSCACYEVLPSDLLWNGCECDFCSQFLPFYDSYLMDHAYYDSEGSDFKDMIAPRLFGVFGTELTRRLQNSYDLDALKLGPSTAVWNFHGYKAITCFNDVDECMFDQRLSNPLAVCVSHFLLDPLRFIVENCPNLRVAVLSGIYFSIDDYCNISCVYDSPERVLPQ